MAALALQDHLYLHAHDESGKMLTHQSSLDIGLTGAVLIQQWLTGRIALVDGLVVVRSSQPTGDPLGDRMMGAILSLSNAHAPRTWLGWLSDGAYERVRDHLLERKVIAPVRNRRFGMGKTRYGIADSATAIHSHGRTRYAVLGFERPDPVTSALCGLIAVLRVEAGLYVNLPAGEALNRLEVVGRASDPQVREIVTAVDATVASASVSMYR